MTWLRVMALRIREMFAKQRLDAELDEELQSHLEMLAEENVQRGMSAEEARRAAKIALGGVEQIKEAVRDQRGMPLLESLAADARFGVRMLRKNPGFTAVSVLTLALGIGANTAVFSVIQGVLLRPLPYKSPESLVEIWNTYFPTLPQIGLSGADFENWTKQSHNLEMAAYRFVDQEFNVTDEGKPERVDATYATSTLFPLLGVRPVLGQTPSPEEDKRGSPPVLLISNRFWHSHFGSDPSVVGRIINLDGKGYTLIGVLPGNFHLVPWADLWLPVGQMDPDELTGRVYHPFGVVARLKPGIGIPQAQAEIATLANQAMLEFPATNRNFGVILHRLEDSSSAKMRRALLLLFVAVGLVLMIACANVANLLLSRNTNRQKEIALRAAIGASQSRLVRQLLTESLLLSFVGGALGVFLAAEGLRVLETLVPLDLDNVTDAGLNGWVLGFAISVCLLTGIVCGLAPALQSLKVDLNSVLKEGGRGARAFGSHRLQRALVVSEVALSVILLIGAGLLLRSFHQLTELDPGFRSDHLLTMQVPQAAIPASELRQMSSDQVQKLSRKQSLQFRQIADHIKSLPGVEQVEGIDWLPLASSTTHGSRFVIEGQPVPATGARPSAEFRTTSVGYFSAMGIPLIKGRLFNENDWAVPRVVINEAMARRFWPGADPIGKRVNLCSLAPQPCWSSVIGVVGDLHQLGLDAPSTFDVYGTGGWTPYFVIRTLSDPLSLASEATEEVHKIDPSLPVVRVMTMDQLLSDSVSPRRFSTFLLGIFAVLALSLSAVGVYGVISYAVSQRTNEIGVRLALGAERSDILKMVIGEGIRPALLGVGCGIVGALALTRLLSGLLYGVTPTDSITFTSVVLLLLGVGLLACYIPARRATKIDPMVALRHE